MGEIKDTKMIQVTSVIIFMERLGYEYNVCKGRFNTYYDTAPANTVLSWPTAIKLHNGSFEFYNKKGNPKNIWGKLFTKIRMEKALEAKIVENAKLQYSKNKGLIVQSHIVKFVDESYCDLFFD